MEDFGYWYNPDGRTTTDQSKFELAEVKPQALEWMFSVACGKLFHVSADNLTSDASVANDKQFKLAVVDQAQQWCLSGRLPIRGLQFLEALMNHYDIDAKCTEHYQLKHLV